MEFANPFAQAPEYKPRKKEVNEPQHIRLVHNLRERLIGLGHPEACRGDFSCDPWNYEPILFDDLIKRRIAKDDPAELNKLRADIRAGSWMTHVRTDPKDALADLHDLEKRETEGFEARKRHSDPDTKKELHEEMERIGTELRGVEAAIESGATGDELESATRAVEDLHVHAWLELKKHMKMRGLDLAGAKSFPITKQIINEIELLRPLRDFLYFRRVYPERLPKTSRIVRP